jgi:hypothetical protein
MQLALVDFDSIVIAEDLAPSISVNDSAAVIMDHGTSVDHRRGWNRHRRGADRAQIVDSLWQQNARH